ncbi:MAG: hypothetical protein C0508_13560 [Cyanobacteria bacterium PR.023]|nr:hypothetical protein [Cyanobacteria bacterium PR.023]
MAISMVWNDKILPSSGQKNKSAHGRLSVSAPILMCDRVKLSKSKAKPESNHDQASASQHP